MKLKNPLLIPVGGLFNAARGTVEKYNINEKVDLGDDIEPEGNVKAEFELIKTKDSIVVPVKKLEVQIFFECPKCLDPKIHKLIIENFDREFFFEKPRKDFDPMEKFLVNMRDLTIDLTEMFRQEIILHFPLNPLCFSGCKGLCHSCGINLNHERIHKASCQANTEENSDPSVNRPLAHLKDYFNNQ
jgi:uncharacterized protein